MIQSLFGANVVMIRRIQVGETNSTLVDALGAGNDAIARDNTSNRRVPKDAAIYFDNEAKATEAIDTLTASDVFA